MGGVEGGAGGWHGGVQSDLQRSSSSQRLQTWNRNLRGGVQAKAKCDSLICAAKVLHPILFNPVMQHQIAAERSRVAPIRKFKQECEFLSTIRHSNVVQYLGLSEDPDTGLPVLLMELMDENLTHFLHYNFYKIK